MELSEACDKLAELMESDEWAREHKGAPIQLFHDYLKDGETPAMALALVKKRLLRNRKRLSVGGTLYEMGES